ncbi:MAG TPA: tRNA pseudouridine(55) synthase TruB [Candidatus Atribacteria bacterium]|nr:tRNA pseudouridine(55) synthase TruB [Candidatus Atribacteria bacterium]
MSGGILNVYKPVGMTSFEITERVGKILGEKAGHTGTLDPFARGVMIICWGKATRLASFFQTLDKTYRARIRFGISTDTYDVTGKIVKVTRGKLSRKEGEELLLKYQGVIKQLVPPFSASKYQGKPRYRYARRGKAVPVREKEVEIYDLELVSWEEGEWPEAEILVRCSSGTYIRSLAHEWGEDSGLGAYLFSLRRGKVGNFSLEQSEEITEREIDRQFLLRKSIPPDQALYWLPSVYLEEKEVNRVKQGRPIFLSSPGEGWVKMYEKDRFLGLGKIEDSGELKSRIILGE